MNELVEYAKVKGFRIELYIREIDPRVYCAGKFEVWMIYEKVGNWHKISWASTENKAKEKACNSNVENRIARSIESYK